MPPRLDLLTKRWSTFDLPILPFLAPRVFTPWPRGVRRSHSGPSAPRKHEPSRYFLEDGENLPQETLDVPRKIKKRRGKIDSVAGPNLDLLHSKNQAGIKESVDAPPECDGSKASAKPEPARYFWDDNDRALQSPYERPPSTKKHHSAFDSKSQYDTDVPHSDTARDGMGEALSNLPGREHGFDQPSEPSEGQDDFLATYEEIWGPVMKKKLPESSVTPVRTVESDVRGLKPGLRNSSYAVLSSARTDSVDSQQSLLADLELEDLKYKQAVETPWHTKPQSEKIVQQQAPWTRASRRENWFEKPKVERIKQQQMLWLAATRKKRRFKSQNQVRGMPEVRLKFVRVAPEGEFGNFNFSSFWNWRFAKLHSRYDKTLRRSVGSGTDTYAKARVSRHFIRTLIEDRSLSDIREQWGEIPLFQRSHIWPDVMLATLGTYPTRTLDVLEATFMPPFPAGYAVSDSLDFILSHYESNPGSYGAEFLVALSKAIHFFLTEGPAGHVHLSQRTLRRLLQMICSDERKWRFRSGQTLKMRRGYIARSIYRTLVELDQPMHENTLVQFASGLAKQGEVKTACGILKKLKERGCDFNSPKLLSLCSTLLKYAHQKSSFPDCGEPLITATNIFQYMLEAGTEPNIVTYNVLIQNSVEVGDHETAWQIHQTMIENGPAPDAYTYSILLNDSKLRMDPSAIRAVMDHVRQNEIRNNQIATDILHAILLLHQQERRTVKESGELLGQQGPVFTRMLQVYRDHFHIGPLAQIIPNFSETYPRESTDDTQDHLQDPPGPTLVVMITGFLDNAQTSYPAWQFYEHFRNLVLQNDPVVAPLTRTTNVWNLVLMSFGKFPERVADCPNIIGDMLSSTDDTLTAAQSPVSDGSIQAEPEDIIANSSELPSAPKNATPELISPGEELQVETKPLTPENAMPGPFGSEETVLAETHVHGNAANGGDSSPDFSSEPHPETIPKPLTLAPPKPDIYTWSILLKIFMDHHQPRAAEKVLTMMRERGIEPNQVTWNGLAVGYARMQDAPATVDVVQRLEDSGLSADTFTMKALETIRNRRALIEAMKWKEARPLRVERELVESLREELQVVSEDDKDRVDADGAFEKIWGVEKEKEEEWW